MLSKEQMEQLVAIPVNEAINRNLPKWPQTLITGPDVTVEQAKEIIFRTDTFFISPYYPSGGNNHRWNNWAWDVLGYKRVKELAGWDHGDEIERSVQRKIELAFFDHFKPVDRLQYLHNTWASSCFIYGPYGFCSPEGKIQYLDNIGKWPNVSDVIDDLRALSDAFPFLELWITLMNAEEGENDKKPVVTLHLKNQIVQCYEGTLIPFQGKPQQRGEYIYDHANRLEKEVGIPDDWIWEIGLKTRPFINSILKKLNYKPVIKSRRKREGRYKGFYEGKHVHGTRQLVIHYVASWMAMEEMIDRKGLIWVERYELVMNNTRKREHKRGVKKVYRKTAA